MKNALIYILGFSLLLLSCQKDPTYTLTPTDYPANFDIDINQDGIVDFTCEYWQISTSDIPVSGSAIQGSLTPTENVSSLYKVYVDNLFLTPNDTIFDTDTSDYRWMDGPADIITKSWNNNSGWDLQWEINSLENEYYFAFKLQNAGADQLGWLKLEMDVTTGEVTVVDQAITSASFLVI